MWNPISDLKALQKNSVEFFLFRVWLLDALKRTLKIFPKRLLSKGIKKRRLKFNPGLVLIGLRTTGPSRGLTLWAGKFRLRSGSYASLSRIQTLPITLVELSCPVCWLLVSILQYVRFTVNSSLDSYSTRGSPGSSKHLQWRWRSISYGYQKTLKSADLTS